MIDAEADLESANDLFSVIQPSDRGIILWPVLIFFFNYDPLPIVHEQIFFFSSATSPLHMNEFCFVSTFVKSNKVRLGT